MNQTYSGLMLLVGVIGCILLLFFIASVMKSKSTNSVGNQSKLKVKVKEKPNFKSKPGTLGGQANQQLIKLKKRVAKSFPELTASLRDHYVVIERQSRKVAMLTIDSTVAIGRRRLGDVIVINFHQLPSVEELKIELDIKR